MPNKSDKRPTRAELFLEKIGKPAPSENKLNETAPLTETAVPDEETDTVGNLIGGVLDEVFLSILTELFELQERVKKLERGDSHVVQEGENT